jgi:hypothetical protein
VFGVYSILFATEMGEGNGGLGYYRLLQAGLVLGWFSSN